MARGLRMVPSFPPPSLHTLLFLLDHLFIIPYASTLQHRCVAVDHGYKRHWEVDLYNVREDAVANICDKLRREIAYQTTNSVIFTTKDMSVFSCATEVTETAEAKERVFKWYKVTLHAVTDRTAASLHMHDAIYRGTQIPNKEGAIAKLGLNRGLRLACESYPAMFPDDMLPAGHCPICHDDFKDDVEKPTSSITHKDGEAPRRLDPHNHHVHDECVTKWLSGTPQRLKEKNFEWVLCPLDRRPLL